MSVTPPSCRFCDNDISTALCTCGAARDCSAATKLDDALADVESFIVNGGYEVIFDGKERHALQMDRRKALAAMSEIKNVLREAGHRV